MKLLFSESIFIVVGCLIGFGGILMSILTCLLSPEISSGSTALKFVMLAFLLCYLYNSIYLTFYLSHLLLSCLLSESKKLFLVYVHHGVQLILSIIITVLASKLWETFRTTAHSIRFSQCDDSHMTLVHGLNGFVDFFCDPSRGPDYGSDGCRRWLAQIPLIFLTLASILVVHCVGQLWNKFDGPDDDGDDDDRPKRKEAAGVSNFCQKCQKCEDCCWCTCDCNYDRKPAKPPKSPKHHHDRDDCRSRYTFNNKYHHDKGVSLEKVLRDCINCD